MNQNATQLYIESDGHPSLEKAELRSVRSEPKARSDQLLVCGVTTQMFYGLLFAIVAAPSALQVPHWLQASAIGCILGALVLAGLSCSWTTHRLRSAAYVMLLAPMAHVSLRAMTDLQYNSCGMLICLLITGGWALGLALTPWCGEERHPACATKLERSIRRGPRWSLWDITCLTTLVANMCWFAPHMEPQLELICRLLPTLIGGLFVSAIALEWAWRDCWSLKRLLALLAVVPLACLLCLAYAPVANDAGEMARWLLAGPASVMAAQGLIILLCIAAGRIDAHCSILTERDRRLLASLTAASVAR